MAEHRLVPQLRRTLRDRVERLVDNRVMEFGARRRNTNHQAVIDRLAQRTDLDAALALADRMIADPDAVSAADKLRYVAVSIDFGEAEHDPDAGTQAQDFLRRLADDLDTFAAAVAHPGNDDATLRIAAEALVDRLR